MACCALVGKITILSWLSTVHTVHEVSSWATLERKRPSTSSTNANITRKFFGDLPLAHMSLDIPVGLTTIITT